MMGAFKSALVTGTLLVAAAGPLRAGQTENVEAEPVSCWWRTGAGGVRIGESFVVVLTCSLVETDSMRVIADQSRLEPSILQLPPFDVVSGSRATEVVTAGRRFIQYQYTLRIIAENAFGRDVSLPPLQLTYRIEHLLSSGPASVAESVQGRDLPYVLPPLSVRVLSLVPDNATDIREAPVATFDEIADRTSRAAALRIAAGLAFAAGALLAAWAIVGLARKRRAAPPGRLLPDSVILDGVRRELAAIREESRSGWNVNLAGRALAALRIAAAYEAGRPVTQTLAPSGSSPADGQLAVNGRIRGVALVSGSETSARAAREGTTDTTLGEGLARFTAARYGRDGRFEASRLDESLDDGLRIVERLAASRKPRLGARLWMR